MTAARAHPWDRWAWACAAAFLLLVPVRIPIGPERFNLEASDCAAIGWLISVALAGGWRSPHSRLGGWAGAYLLLMLPAVLHSSDAPRSLVALAKSAYLMVLGLALGRWLRPVEAWDRFVRLYATVVGAMIVVALGVWLYADWSGHVPARLAVHMLIPNVGDTVRVKATLLTPTLLANYLTMGLPLVVASIAAVSRSRIATWLWLWAGVLATVTTASHSLAGGLVAAAMVAPHGRRAERIARIGLWTLAAATALFALASTTIAVQRVQVARAPASATDPLPLHAVPGQAGGGEDLTIHASYHWVSYGVLKRIAWDAWRRHPWVGIGPGVFPYEVGVAYAAGRIHYPWADPHSTWLGGMAETGLLGLVGLVWLWVGVFRIAARARLRSVDRWRVQAPLAGLLGLLVNSVHVDVMHFRFLWVAVGLVISAASPGHAREHGHGGSA